MYIERLVASGTTLPPEFGCDFRDQNGEILKWKILPQGDLSRVLIRYLAMTCTGRDQHPTLCRMFAAESESELIEGEFKWVIIRHAPQEAGLSEKSRIAFGASISAHAKMEYLRPYKVKEWACELSLAVGKSRARYGNYGWLMLGYGPQLCLHEGNDSLSFADPLHRLKRMVSLFDPDARLTDPLAFLERLHRKGVKYKKERSLKFITRLNRELSGLLAIAPDAWLVKQYDFRREWDKLNQLQQVLATVALDAARHLLDSSFRCPDPYDQTGIMVLDGMENWCPRNSIPEFLELLNSAFPRLQMIVTLSAPARRRFSSRFLEITFPIPVPAPRKRKRLLHLPQGTVLLIDVDSQLPNLALMKLSQHFKAKGRRVVLARKEAKVKGADEVYASCVFNFPPSTVRVDRLRQYYGSALNVGGSGVDIKLRLDPAIETLPADYSLYPELGDRAIGFLTRGCPLHCPFCIVPIKEGKPRAVSDLNSLLENRRKKLILLDDNILSHPNVVEFLEEMLRRDLMVNFNQTLDVRMLTKETAGLLRRIQCSNVRFTRRNYYFSLNNTRSLELVRQRYELLQVDRNDNVEFVCMYGFDTTLADDVKRFQFLRTLPGAYVFLQRYRPVLGGPEAVLTRYFGDDADEQIDALLRVNFTQNMKSMEVYYRWLCLLYAEQCRRVHRPLVETLYRYNGRHRMGAFLTKLDGICQD